jgi:hypothetical protein
LFKPNDSSIYKINSSGQRGSYQFTDVAVGKYLLKATSVSYAAYLSDVIDFRGGSITVPDIFLSKTTNQLHQFVVIAKKPLIERKVDRVVFNVQNSIGALGGNAADALRIAPGIQILFRLDDVCYL